MKFEVNRYLVDFVQSNWRQGMKGIVANSKFVHQQKSNSSGV